MKKNLVRKLLCGAALLLSASTAKAGQEVKEYGIVLLPDFVCANKAMELNSKIAQQLNNLVNVKNNLHVDLYLGAYEAKDLKEIYAKLQTLEIQSFPISLTTIYNTEDRRIEWRVQNTAELQQLHEDVVKLASPYHKKMLTFVSDMYKTLLPEERAKADKYGFSRVLDLYNPHMNLFYTYPPDSRLQKASLNVAQLVPNETKCNASKIIIGPMGYNGNIISVVYTIDLSI